MTIRARLIFQTVALQVVSLLLLSYGSIFVEQQLGEKQALRADGLLKEAVAHAATDAMIQRDQVQLLSYLNFLKVQYPALSYAHVVWRRGGNSNPQELGQPVPGARVVEESVGVSDPSSADRSVEITYGVDQDVLRSPMRESAHRMAKVLALVGTMTVLIGFALAVLLSRSLTGTIGALGAMAEQISEGRLGVRLEWESEDEIGALVRVFNAMSERLADLDLAKKNFVSSVTHELRSPLGAIESFVPLIRDKVKLSDSASLATANEYLDRIQANVQRLNRFITDLLDVAKIEQGKMECVLRQTQFGPIASEVIQFFEPKARAQGLRVENQIKEDPAILGDSERLRQVLVNLLANALKFTPSSGRVWISTEQVRERGQRWLHVTVGDTGRGMDEADLARLFKPFSQGVNVTDGVSGPKGTGLGLYIVKSIIDQHGGRIDVRSSPGQGTRITFTLKVPA
jgi:signal transduction histidine kinase